MANKLFGSKSGCSVSFSFQVTKSLQQNLLQDYVYMTRYH